MYTVVKTTTCTFIRLEAQAEWSGEKRLKKFIVLTEQVAQRVFSCINAGGSLRTTLTGFSKPVTCLVNGGDQPAIIAAGSEDGMIMVWEIGVDEVVHTVRTHGARVACLAVQGESSSTENDQ